MNIKEAVVGDYNDGGALIKGNLKCTLFLPFGIGFEILGKTFANETYSSNKKSNYLKEIYIEDDDKILKDLIVEKSVIK